MLNFIYLRQYVGHQNLSLNKVYCIGSNTPALFFKPMAKQREKDWIGIYNKYNKCRMLNVNVPKTRSNEEGW